MAGMKPANLDRQWMAALIPGAVFAVRVKMRLRPANVPPVRGIKAPRGPARIPSAAAQTAAFDADQARRLGPRGMRPQALSKHRHFAPTGRGVRYDQASGQDTRSRWLVGMTCTSPEGVNAAACAMSSPAHQTM